MQERGTNFGLWLFLLVLLAGAGFYFSPHLAMYNLKQAVENRDYDSVAQQVDFPAVRESLFASFNLILQAKASQQGQQNPAEVAAAAGRVEGAVSALATPQNLALMFRGERPVLQRQSREESSFIGKRDTVIDTRYEDFNHFVVSTRKKGSKDAAISFVLTRQGLLSWRLSGVRLPLPQAGDDQPEDSASAIPAVPLDLPALPPQAKGNDSPPVPTFGGVIPPTGDLPALPPAPGTAPLPETGSKTDPAKPAIPATPPEAPAASAKPSFDCSKAKKASEQVVCGNTELAAADVELDKVFRANLKQAEDKEGLKQSQTQWRKTRDACGNDSICVLNAYRQRQEELIFMR